MTGIGGGELAALLVLGLFVFGPEKLPKVVADVVRTVRSLRAQAGTITEEMKGQFAEHVDADELRRLDPRGDLAEDGRATTGRARSERAGAAPVDALPPPDVDGPPVAGLTAPATPQV